MAAKQQIDWPAVEDFLAAWRGDYRNTCRAFAVDQGSLRHHYQRTGVWHLVEERRTLKAPDRALAIGDPVSREEVLEQENDELRKAIRGERRGEIKSERLLGAIERALDNLDVPAPLKIGKQPPLPDGDAHHRAMLLLSDAHGGEVVDPAAVSNLNAYDWEIMHARHEQIVEGTLSHMRRMPPLTGLDVGILGDGCSGANHRELEVSNEMPLAQQGIRMGFEFGEIIAKLATAGGKTPLRVRVFGVPGNHPRLTEKPAAKSVLNNMDYVSMIVAEERTRHLTNVAWTQPEGAAMFWEIAGQTCYVWHGDGVRSSMPGVPWGGVMRRVNAIQAQHSRHIAHFIHGHYHQANVVQGGRIIGNGSVKGVDEWVLKSFGGGDRPTQLLLVFDERAQRLTDVRYLTPTAGLP